MFTGVDPFFMIMGVHYLFIFMWLHSTFMLIAMSRSASE